tara:strand:- start:355 stop:516 length:162 start_codon:yes stop_codon:yes gene_type:complete
VVDVLSEINIGDSVIEPVMNVLNKKKKPKMLEEQIRDSYPCDVEPEEDENEDI